MNNDIEKEVLNENEVSLKNKEASYQPFPEKRRGKFNWPKFVYLWGLATILKIWLAMILVDHIYSKMYVFDSPRLGDPSYEGMFAFTGALESLLTFPIFLLCFYYIFGKNKPYWMSIFTVTKKSVIEYFMIAILFFGYITVGTVLIAALPILSNSESRMMHMLVKETTFNSTFHNLVNPVDDNQIHSVYDINSDECKKIDKAVSYYLKDPIEGDVDVSFKKMAIIEENSFGCISTQNAFNAMKSISNRFEKIRDPSDWMIHKLWKISGKDFSEVYAIKDSMTHITNKDVCEILPFTDNKDRQNRFILCSELPKTILLNQLPQEKTFEEFYKNNNHK